MASFEDKFRELERVFEKLSAKFDSQLLASSSYGFDSPGIRSKVGYDDRTLLVKIHLEEYSVSWDVLNQMFSKIGYVECIEIFDHDSQFHSQVRFQEHGLAAKAFEYFDGRCIYDGCCRMELSLGNGADGRLSEIDVPIEDSSKLQSQESSRRIYKKLNEISVLMGRCPVEVLSDETEKPTPELQSVMSDEDIMKVKPCSPTDLLSGISELQSTLMEEEIIGVDPCNLLFSNTNISPTDFKVIPNSTEIITFEIEYEDITQLVADDVKPLGITWDDIKMSSHEIFRIHSAPKLFEKIPEKKMVDADKIVELLNVLRDFYGLIDSCSSFVFDPGKNNEFWVEILLTLVFDPRGILTDVLNCVCTVGIVEASSRTCWHLCCWHLP